MVGEGLLILGVDELLPAGDGDAVASALQTMLFDEKHETITTTEQHMFDTITEDTLAQVHGGGFARAAGEKLGFGAGVAVTGALALVPGWNEQVAGRPAGFQKRHEAVVGPKVGRYADSLAPGAWKDFTSGVASGATVAPGWTFEHGF